MHSRQSIITFQNTSNALKNNNVLLHILWNTFFWKCEGILLFVFEILLQQGIDSVLTSDSSLGLDSRLGPDDSCKGCQK